MPIIKVKRCKRSPHQYQYIFDCSIRGKRFKKRISCSQSEVNGLYQEWYDHLSYQHSGASPKLFFDNFILYLDQYCKYKKSEKQYRTERRFLETRLKAFFPGDTRLENISRKDIERYIQYRFDHMQRIGRTTRSTINKDVNILSSFFKWCIHNELYDRANPCSGLRVPEQNERYIHLAGDQIREIIDLSKEYGTLHTAVMIAIYSGLRRNELISLKWSDIDFVNKYINVRQETTKTKRFRAIPINDELFAFLKGLSKDRKHVYVGSVDVLRSRFKDMRKRLSFRHLLSVKNLAFHDLRHVFAQTLRDAGVSLSDIAAFLGHTTTRMVEKRYAQAGGYNGHVKINKMSTIINQDAVSNIH